MRRTTNYPIGDFLTSLKNIVLARGKVVEFSNIRLVREVALCLFRMGFVDKVEEDVENKTVRVFLKYKNKEPLISDIKLVSRPSLRVYWSVKSLEEYKKPQMLIISTPKGILSSKEALKERVGGEVIASVW